MRRSAVLFVLAIAAVAAAEPLRAGDETPPPAAARTLRASDKAPRMPPSRPGRRQPAFGLRR